MLRRPGGRPPHRPAGPQPLPLGGRRGAVGRGADQPARAPRPSRRGAGALEHRARRHARAAPRRQGHRAGRMGPRGGGARGAARRRRRRPRPQHAAALRPARPRGGAPGRRRVVLHLHNYRLFCAIGIAYRDGAPCYRCTHRNTLPGVRLRCRGSLPEAVAYAAGLAVHQPLVWDSVDRFVVPGASAAARLEALGLPSGRTHVVPNFVEDSALAPSSRPAPDATRCSPAGWWRRRAPTPLSRPPSPPRAAADRGGRAGGAAHSRARRRGATRNVGLLGHLDRESLAREYAGAAVTLLPSRWGEPCPHAALESRAMGVPVLGSRIDDLTDIIGEETSVDPFDVPNWAARSASCGRPGQAHGARRRGHRDTRERFSESAVHDRVVRSAFIE